MQRLIPLFTVIFLFIVFSCTSDQPTTNLYIVRHAEKVKTDTTDNPGLTEVGAQRANRLVAELEGVALDGIFSTPYERNLATVRPLAAAKGLDIQIYEPLGFQSMLDSLKGQSGKNYLICGHSNTVMPMIGYLGAEKPAEALEENEYGKLFKVRTQGKGGPTLEVKTY